MHSLCRNRDSLMEAQRPVCVNAKLRFPHDQRVGWCSWLQPQRSRFCCQLSSSAAFELHLQDYVPHERECLVYDNLSYAQNLSACPASQCS